MASIGDRPAKSFSCKQCFDRKIRCDKHSPCSNCVKSKVECIFRVPPAPRRKKKRPQEEVLLARLKKCEDLLKSKGIDIDSPRTQTPSSVTASEGPTSAAQLNPDASLAGNPADFYPAAAQKAGQLIVDQGKSRFVENSLWASLSDEV